MDLESRRTTRSLTTVPSSIVMQTCPSDPADNRLHRYFTRQLQPGRLPTRNDRLSARVAYNWRGESTPRGPIGGLPVTAQPYGQWDARVSYNLRDNWTLFLEGINLGNEDVTQYFGDLQQEIADYSEVGRRINFGVRVEF